ncbi:SRPBCC domain-containing protein, partial [Corynebacterium diphtheriae]
MSTAEQKQAGQHRDGSDFVITHTFDAPRELVFQSWVEPERLAQWWGPVGFELSVPGAGLAPGRRASLRHARRQWATRCGASSPTSRSEAPEKIVSIQVRCRTNILACCFETRTGLPVCRPHWYIRRVYP